MYSRWHRRRRPTRHRPELEHRELAACPCRAAPAGRRPGRRVAPDAPGDVGEERGGQDEQHEGADEVDARASRAATTATCRAGGKPDERQALDRVDADLRRHDLEQARHDVDLHVELAQLADEIESLGSARRENATTTRSTSTLDGSAPEARRAGPSVRSRRARRRSSRGSSSTKPTRLMPYSGCWRNLRAMSWPTSPAPTMIVFWT